MRFKIFQRATLFLLLWISISSCAHLLDFDAAQSAFSKGAELETRQLFASNIINTEGNAIDISQSVQKEMTDITPDFYYARAYAAINRSIKKNGELKKDDLLGNALALKALCEWKLKKYGEARLTAQKANFALLEQTTPSVRDKAVMTALEGFIENDLAYNALNDIQNNIDDKLSGGALEGLEAAQLYDDIKAFYGKYIHKEDKSANIDKAIKIIQSAIDQTPANHPLQVYLVMSQLVCMKNWSDALNATNELLKKLGLNDENSSAKKWLLEETDKYVAEKDKHLNSLSDIMPQGENDALFREWKRILY